MCGKVHILCLAVGLPILLVAAPVSTETAVRRAEAWLARRQKVPKGPRAAMRPSRRPSGRVRTCSAGGTNLFHLVSLEGGGFVAVSSDDGQMPVMGFSASDELPTPDDGGPLWTLLKADAVARRSGKLAAFSNGAVASEAGIDDVRVSPLIQSKWDQRYVGGKATYNYYTTNHWYCGCVATAMSQLMRYHRFPTHAVTPRTFTCYVGAAMTPVNMTMKGGTYNWSNMPLVPTSAITTVEREAIGRICYDAGVSIRMHYTSGGSGALPFEHDPLRNVFGFANAQTFLLDGTLSDANIRAGILTNLDAGCPVLLGINDGRDSGHAILADGYGYVDGTLYCHLNMGWSGSYDYWYALPSIPAGSYSFTAVDSVSYNIFPARTGELATGRVSDTSGRPIAGATVSATMKYKKNNRNYTSTTNVATSANGVYVIFAPAGVSCTVTLAASFDGQTTTNITARTKASSSPTSINYETGTYSYSGSGLAIGNSWGNDFVIKVKSKFAGILVR